ncbi:hypothetical protein SAMN02927916_1616 [Flavobacterium anhuiense]|uniref:Uncharacterized protein n=1 Tax=Flavobacterium anhuiense TaxID=459526 RepID=A0ABY0LJT6_9FLAO|nr:hypothetical protein [Flavobacterium anhuiense]SCY25164.1 hypothetical protein SAMN02927916_1616 [Flavobacterium anhuiense]
MTILPSLDIFEKYISNSRDKVFSDINCIFFNENIDVLITSNYLELLEMYFDNNDLIQALIIELSDKNRTVVNYVDNELQNTYENFYEKIYTDNIDSLDCLYAISIGESPNIIHYQYSKKNKQNLNKEFLIFELLISNIISLHYYNFASNTEIQNLIKNVFKLPKKISRILIYNRYSESNYFHFLKHKSIHYFNAITGSNQFRRTEFIRIENDLKQNLGRNLVLKSTNDLTKIHERKILFNNFILTFDHSFNSTIVSEPSWKIDIEIDRKICLSEWNKKHQYFSRIN